VTTNVGFINLGCPRNLTDSELMLGVLERAGYCIVDIKCIYLNRICLMDILLEIHDLH